MSKFNAAAEFGGSRAVVKQGTFLNMFEDFQLEKFVFSWIYIFRLLSKNLNMHNSVVLMQIGLGPRCMCSLWRASPRHLCICK